MPAIYASPYHPSYSGDDLRVVTNPSLDAQARYARTAGMISSPGDLLNLSRPQQVLANARANGSNVYIMKSTLSGIPANPNGQTATMNTQTVAVAKTPQDLKDLGIA
jgi:hypothetical protein